MAAPTPSTTTDVAPAAPAEGPRWFGSFTIPEGRAGRWRLGPMSLSAEHLLGEWRLIHAHGDEPMDTALEVSVPTDATDPLPRAETLRFAFDTADDDLRVLPSAADRSIVARPETPFYLAARQRTTIYLSTPLWCRVEWGRPLHTLLDVPTSRPSDTWFGPNTREGELCYASRTKARLRLDLVPRRPGRVMTAVALDNRAADALFIERVNIPAPFLSVFFDGAGDFWTETIRVEREADGEICGASIDHGAPREAGTAERVAEPRRVHDRNVMMRAFRALVG